MPLDHAECTRDKAHVIFADNTRRRWAQTLGEEFASGDCHAGRYESSIVLAADGDGVRRDELERLPAKEIHLLRKMGEGVKSFKEAGADLAYCGTPAEATPEEGEELIDRLGEMIVTSVREAWPELF